MSVVIMNLPFELFLVFLIMHKCNFMLKYMLEKIVENEKKQRDAPVCY